MPGQWQISFDHGHQQRYLPDRQAVLTYVLAIGPKAASQRFEVFTEAPPIRLADGSPGGRAFSLVEVIDLARPGEPERLRAELRGLSMDPGSGWPDPPPVPAGPGTQTTPAPPAPAVMPPGPAGPDIQTTPAPPAPAAVRPGPAGVSVAENGLEGGS